MFVIEDEWHAEPVARFATRDAALAELERLSTLPWDAAPNRAPCQSSRTCGRCYELVTYDDGTSAWREVGRTPMLEVSRDGVRWLTG